jgi:hypothetical protein
VLFSTAPVQNTVQRLADDLFTLRKVVQEFIDAMDGRWVQSDSGNSIEEAKRRIEVRGRLITAGDNLRREMGGIPE